MKSEVKAAAKVFEEEPKRNKESLELDSMIATSHKRVRTEETRKKANIQIAKKVIEALEKMAS